MLFPVKDKNEMLDEMLIDLVDKTGINDLSHGAIARSILEIVNDKINKAYNYLSSHSALLMLSTSEGDWLSLIGYMVNCTRLAGESDDNYRYRISQQIFTAATANETAIRLRCLSVAGVKDIIITKYTRGSGSFSVHVITDEIDTPDDVLSNVRRAVSTYKAEGVRAIVEKPRIVPIDMELSVAGDKSIVPENIEILARDGLTDYLDSLGMGSGISTQKLISLVLNVDKVSQAYLTNIRMNDQAIVVKEFYNLEWDQRAYIRSLKIKVIE